MDTAIWLMTLYGGAYGLFLVKLSYDIGHEFHHWMFGLITTIAIIPVIIINIILPRDYYISTIIMALIIGPTSFIMDYHDFKKWMKQRRKQALKDLSKELKRLQAINERKHRKIKN